MGDDSTKEPETTWTWLRDAVTSAWLVVIALVLEIVGFPVLWIVWWLVLLVFLLIVWFLHGIGLSPRSAEQLMPNDWNSTGWVVYVWTLKITVIAIPALPLVVFGYGLAKMAASRRSTERLREVHMQELERERPEREAREAEERVRRLEAEAAIRLRKEELQAQLRKRAELAAAEAEAEHQKNEDQAKRQRATDAAWDRLPKLWSCKAKGHLYPHYLKPVCPICGSRNEQEEVLAFPDQLERAVAEILAGKTPQPSQHAERPTSVPQNEITAAADRLSKQAGIRDYLGVGNLTLDLLMQHGQQERPDALCEMLALNIRRIVATRFGIPEVLDYCQPLRDEFLTWEQRGKWTCDTMPHLIILAYVLGATTGSLRPPHDRLVPFYRELAKRQQTALESAAATWRGQRVTPDEIEGLVNNDDPDVTAEMKLRVLQQKLAGDPVPPPKQSSLKPAKDV